MGSNSWINVAVVGCGRIYNDAHRNAYIHPATNHIAVVGLCDIREDLAKDQLKWLKKSYEKIIKEAKKQKNQEALERVQFALDHLKLYTSYQKMLDDLEGTLQLVDNCTPGRLHIPLSIQAMEHGYHAMAEKPPGLNWWDVKRMVETEKKTKKQYCLQEHICYEPIVQRMREVILEGKVGKIEEVQIQFGHGGPYVPYHFGESGLPHFIDPLWSGGGCLQDLAPHGISQGYWPIGSGVKPIACLTKKLERRQHPRKMSGKPFENKLDDWAEAEIECYDPRTKSTFNMPVTTSWCGGFPFPFNIEGDNGTLVVNYNPETKSKEPCVMNEEEEKFFSVSKDQWEPTEPHIREIQIFADNILHNVPCGTPGEYALHLQEIISMHYYSKLMKKRITIEEMEQWGTEIGQKSQDSQKTVDEIALKLTSAVDLLN
jgi:predicted dehydrogenase